MNTYTLEVIFNKKDLEVINRANEKVVLIKEVSQGGHKVAWVTFTAYEHNTVTWHNDLVLYASLTQPIEGEQITVLTTQEAQAQNQYTFENDRTFSDPQPDPKLQPGQYMICNNLPNKHAPSQTFGMAQACNLNSRAKDPKPINAALVPAQHFVKFTLTDTLLIFLAANIGDSTVHNDTRLHDDIRQEGFDRIHIYATENYATKLNFSTSNKISVKYSAINGQFIPFSN